VSLQAREDPEYGCWAFPSSQPVTVAAGQTSDEYTMGGYTAGSTGGCGATDVTGSWRG